MLPARFRLGAGRQVAASDSCGLTGKLWRTAEADTVNYYQVRYCGRRADPRDFTPNELNYYLR
jgi:hypothetical protein